MMRVVTFHDIIVAYWIAHLSFRVCYFELPVRIGQWYPEFLICKPLAEGSLWTSIMTSDTVVAGGRAAVYLQGSQGGRAG